MKSKILKILLMCLLTSTSYSVELPKYFYKNLQGTIGGEKVNLNMIRIDTSITGSYYYEKYGKAIEFSSRSSIKDNQVFIEEDNFRMANYRVNITGYFQGEFTDEHTFKGTWTKPDSSKVWDFTLTESYPAGCAGFSIIHKEDSWGNCDSLGCATISVIYPVMQGYPNSTVQDSVNEFILGNVLFPKVDADSTLKNGRFDSAEDLIKEFIERFKADQLEYQDAEQYGFNWGGDYSMMIDINEDYLLGLTMYEYSYLGGAHGTFMILHYNIDLRTGKEIKLDDIFKEGYETKLNQLAEKIFRSQYEVPRRQNLEEAGFWFKDNKFALNENFGLGKEGITFQYNQYEVAAYAVGSPEVFIPWGKIADLIKEKSIVESLLKK